MWAEPLLGKIKYFTPMLIFGKEIGEMGASEIEGDKIPRMCLSIVRDHR